MSKEPSIQDLEGAVNVNGTVTPISRQPITTVTSDKWGTMGRTELFNQRQAMDARLAYASQIGNPEMIKALQAGIAQIDARLNQLYTDELGLL